MSRLRLGLVRLALVALSLVVTLLLVEGVLRLATPPTIASGRAFAPWLAGRVVFDPIRGWRNVPGTFTGHRAAGDGWEETTYEVERHGFRGPEVADRKPEGAVRIVCMGDSGTFGAMGIPLEDGGRTYYSVLSYVGALRERVAREGLDHVEVINAGVIGYSSHQGLRQLMVQILDLDPDVVTLRFSANDVQPAWGPQHRTVEPESPLLRALLYRFAGWRTMRVLMRVQTRPMFHPEANSLDWASSDEYRRNLEKMIARSRARGVRVLLIDYPVHHEGWSKLKDLQKLTRAIADEHDVPFLQTGPLLLADGVRGFRGDDLVHPNEWGARAIADRLFDGLRDLGWIGAAPR